METASSVDDRAVLLAHFRESAATASSLRSLQTEIVESIAQRLGHYNWTGFYMLDPKDDQVLVLVHTLALQRRMYASPSAKVSVAQQWPQARLDR